MDDRSLCVYEYIGLVDQFQVWIAPRHLEWHGAVNLAAWRKVYPWQLVFNEDDEGCVHDDAITVLDLEIPGIDGYFIRAGVINVQVDQQENLARVGLFPLVPFAEVNPCDSDDGVFELDGIANLKDCWRGCGRRGNGCGWRWDGGRRCGGGFYLGGGVGSTFSGVATPPQIQARVDSASISTMVSEIQRLLRIVTSFCSNECF